MLKCSNGLAANTVAVWHALMAAAAELLQVPLLNEPVDDSVAAGDAWQDRERQIEEHRFDVVWMCGLLASIFNERAKDAQWRPLVAPVMCENKQPVYHSLVVAHTALCDEDDWSSKTFLFNDQNSL